MDRLLTEVVRHPRGCPTPAEEVGPTALPTNATELLQWTETWIRRHPGASLGIAVFVGACIGWLVKRK